MEINNVSLIKIGINPRSEYNGLRTIGPKQFTNVCIIGEYGVASVKTMLAPISQ